MLSVFSNPIFRELFQVEFAPVLSICFLLVFIFTNSLLDKRLTRLFLTSISLVIMILIADSVEYYCASLAYPTTARIVASVIGYTLRPAVLMFIILIVYRVKRERVLFYSIPCILVFLTTMTALFSDIAFHYDSDNHFVRGPLGLIPHFTCVFYFGVLIYTSIIRHKEKKLVENMLVLAIIVANGFAVAVEMILKYEGILNIAIMVSITFYYLFINTQAFKRDVLTGAFNRRMFYLDSNQKRNMLSAIISIDLNDLKVINDTKGHIEGDKAICSIVDSVRKVMYKGCYLYRTGGDEFIILVFKKYSKESIEKMIEEIREQIRSTNYTCALGVECVESDEAFDVLLARADKAMYEDKIQIKGKAR